MKGKIVIDFDLQTGKMSLNAPMNTQQAKDLSIKILTGAIQMVVDQPISNILVPHGAMGGNGNPPEPNPKAVN